MNGKRDAKLIAEQLKEIGEKKPLASKMMSRNISNSLAWLFVSTHSGFWLPCEGTRHAIGESFLNLFDLFSNRFGNCNGVGSPLLSNP